jgi:hypothetical protein
VKSRTARAKRRSRQRKLSFNKMPMADTLIDVEPPSRISFSGPDRNGRTQCCVANRTHILAVGYGDNREEALIDAAQTFIDDMNDEARVLLYGNDAADDETMYGADVSNEAALSMAPIKAVLGAFVGTNRENPLHYICPICAQGLNEKCSSVRNGAELKNLHAERRRLGVEGEAS